MASGLRSGQRFSPGYPLAAMSVRQLGLLLDTLPIAFIGHDADGNVVLWNRAASALLGWEREEVLGHASPLPVELSRAEVPRSPAALQPLTLHRKSGGQVTVVSAAMPLPGHEGSACVLWEAESLSREDEAKLRAMCDHAPDGIVVFDGGGAVLEGNAAMGALLGVDPQTLAGRALSSLAADERSAFTLAQLLRREPGARGVLVAENVALSTQGGGATTVDLHASAFAPDRYVGFARDMNASARARSQLALFARIFDSSAEAILITDAHNHVIAANAAFTSITGYELAEVRGKNPSLLSSGRHDRAFYEAMWRALGEQGHWQGELWNRRKSGAVYPEWASFTVIRNERGVVTNYVAVFSDLTAVKRSEEQISFLAQHDHLTGLPNRTLLLDRLTQALASARRDGEAVALLLVDLDDFKAVNGSAGHQVGDDALRRMGERLQGLLRQSDTVARMGGDEFALMIPGLKDARDSMHVVEKVMAAVSAPLRVDEHEVTLTASVGVAIAPQDGDTAAAMLRAADAAMYSARAAGRSCWRYFTDELNVRARERLTLVTALSHALGRGELVLHYQPQRAITGGALIGTEALLRWRRGDELWAAGRFIGAAEDSGLIVALGAWVLREACRQAAKWKLPVSVNVSVKQLEEPDFVQTVEEALHAAGLSADLLEVEVTESVVMHEGGTCVEQLQRLRALGVRVAMDDFGTGYSSLSQLKRLPLTRLKVDRAFVKDLTTDLADFAVTQAVVTLGHALGLQVIAEGVEEEAQREALQVLGCDEVQGYLFGRPVPAERIDEELRVAARAD